MTFRGSISSLATSSTANLIRWVGVYVASASWRVMKVAPARRCRRYCNCAEIYALAGMGGLRRVSAVGCKDGTRLYRSSKSDCQGCAFKAKCCPNTPQRKVPRDLDEDARDVARGLANTPAYERSRHRRKKKRQPVRPPQAHPPGSYASRLRGPSGARDEFPLAATAQNLRKLAKLRAMPAACPVPA